MTNINLLSTEEWNALVTEYQETGLEETFNEIYFALEELAIRLGNKWYGRNKSRNLPADDYISMAKYAIYKAVTTFDGSQGSQFVSYYTTMVGWTIQDQIIKKQDSKSEQAYRNSLSFDYSTEGNEDGGNFVDYLAQDTDEYAGIVDPESDAQQMFLRLLEVVDGFEAQAQVRDGSIIRTVINVAMNEPNPTPKAVNTVLENLFPDVKPATVRQHKKRAIDRFVKYADKNGFTGLSLSQF